jgi:hypothetical protein
MKVRTSTLLVIAAVGVLLACGPKKPFAQERLSAVSYQPSATEAQSADGGDAGKAVDCTGAGACATGIRRARGNNAGTSNSWGNRNRQGSAPILKPAHLSLWGGMRANAPVY